jgi:predicted RNase H-like nuclease
LKGLGISPKINEVDSLLLNVRGQQAHRIREVHPEVCFWALADRKPMEYRKTSVEGRNERLSILRQYEPGQPFGDIFVNLVI